MSPLAVNSVVETYLNRSSYVSISEYQDAPTAMDTSQLVINGTAKQQREALAGVLDRASSVVDTHCLQVLAATEQTQTQVCIPRGGMISLVCWYKPVLALTSLELGATPSTIGPVEPNGISDVWFGVGTINAPSWIASGGRVSTDQPSVGGGSLFARWSYVNGYPHTTLAADAAAGDTDIVVAGPVGAPSDGPHGFFPGSQLQIGDGASYETVVVADSYVSGTTIPLVSPLTRDYVLPTEPNTITVSGLPPAIRQATISVATALIKTRGNAAMVLSNLTSPQFEPTLSNAGVDQDLALARGLLAPYRRAK